jgi:hypothetical protein
MMPVTLLVADQASRFWDHEFDEFERIQPRALTPPRRWNHDDFGVRLVLKAHPQEHQSPAAIHSEGRRFDSSKFVKFVSPNPDGDRGHGTVAAEFRSPCQECRRHSSEGGPPLRAI